jgi:hypothetical protein
MINKLFIKPIFLSLIAIFLSFYFFSENEQVKSMKLQVESTYNYSKNYFLDKNECEKSSSAEDKNYYICQSKTLDETSTAEKDLTKEMLLMFFYVYLLFTGLVVFVEMMTSDKERDS